MISEAVGLLLADLGARMAERFGGEAAPEETAAPFTPPPLPAVEPPRPHLLPTLDVPEHLWDSPAPAEAWLAAFVEHATTDREGLRARLAPLFEGRSPSIHGMTSWRHPADWLRALAMEVVAPGSDPGVPGPDPAAEERRRRRIPANGYLPPPYLFLLRRLSELYTALREGALPPVLLATPTLATGHIDPGVLVDRLERCAAAGVEPLRADLCQALLRLPRGPHPEAAARAARIGSAAASAAAVWLAEGGLPDPETGVRWSWSDGRNEHVADAPDPRYAEHARPVPVLRAKPTGFDLIDELLAEPQGYQGESGVCTDWWASMLPSHREVVAVNLLPFLYTRSCDGPALLHLQRLLAADGPAGEAAAAVLAYFAAAGGSRTLPLLLTAAARGDVPAEAVGRHLAVFLRHPRREPRHALDLLAKAARQGAHREVWRILTTLLPAFLPAPGERPAHAHTTAVVLASDVAAWTGARGEIPVVTAHAGSGSRSRFARECARLRDRLAAATAAGR